MSSSEPLRILKEKVKGVVSDFLTPSDVNMEELKEEIWKELSYIYYKYGDEGQKRAFREVMYEICEKIKEGKWGMVYKKLYSEEQKEKQI